MFPKKILGQNFINNPKTIDKMLSVADLNLQDIILEVGPGKGAITEKLIGKVKQIIAVEKDPELVKYLKSKFKNIKNLKIIKGDILKDQYQNSIISEYPSYKIISNLPFYLTSRFLRVFLELKNKPTLMVLIIQKEVAQRICDQPPQASLLSNSVQFYSDPEIIAYVPKDNFYPQPDVNAAIIKIKTLAQPKIKVADINVFFKIMKIGFAQKRKQLHNNLTAGWHLSKKQTLKLLKQTNIEPQRRAQTLTLEEWSKLYENLESKI